MRRIVYLFAALAIAAPAGTQLPKDVKREIDTFTGDTIYSTAYGRLDQPNGCGRVNLAIIWKLARGRNGQAEFLVYEYFDADGPFSRAKYIGGHSVFLSVDGDIFEVKGQRAIPRLGGDRKTRSETASFILPDSTLYRVASARDARIRIIGTEKTCDGIIEPNMFIRLRALFRYLGTPVP